MLLVILSHRISLILTIVSSIIQVVLPRVLTNNSDANFNKTILQRTQYLIWLGLAGLVTTGLLRLENVFPNFIVIKMLSAGITVIYSLIGHRYVSSPHFHQRQLALLLLTASIGLLI